MGSRTSTRSAPAAAAGSPAAWVHWLVLAAFVAMAPVIALLSARGMSVLLVAGALGLLVTGRRWPPLPDRAATLALASLILLGGASVLWAVAPDVSRVQTLQLLGIAVPGLLVITVMSDEATLASRDVMAWLPIGMLCAFGVLLLELLADFPLYRLLHSLPPGTEVEAYEHNKAATGLSVLLFPALLVLRRRSWWRSLHTGISQAALACIATLGLLATPSQSSIVALGGGLVVLAAAKSREKLVRLGLGMLTIGAAVFTPAAAMLLPASDGGALASLPYSAAQRLEIWRYIADLISDRPLLGVGIDGARHVLAVAEGSIAGSLHPHNLFLQVWLELGAVGAAWLCGFVLSLLAAIGRMHAGTRPYADAGFAAAVLVSSFAWGIWQTWWLATLLVVAAFFSAEARRLDAR